jgi:hypothetical protein
MNFILGKIILIMTEEETFWVFTHLLERILPPDYYAQMMGVNADTEFFKDVLLPTYLPDVFEHFKKYNFNSTFFCYNWFVCLF